MCVCVCVWTWRGDRETLKKIVKMQTSIISRLIPPKLGIPLHDLYATCRVQYWGMTLVGQCDDVSILWFHCWHLFRCMENKSCYSSSWAPKGNIRICWVLLWCFLTDCFGYFSAKICISSLQWEIKYFETSKILLSSKIMLFRWC